MRKVLFSDSLNEVGSLDVSTLAKALNVSAVTIRKDLALLEEKRLRRRRKEFLAVGAICGASKDQFEED
jgi:DeoR/GlpR family transcriptional regulator of sugar metabolism